MTPSVVYNPGVELNPRWNSIKSSGKIQVVYSKQLHHRLGLQDKMLN